MQTTRRQFLRSGFGCALGMTLARTISLAATAAKTIPIGFQLYTVRGEFSRNVPGTLKRLGEIGYKGVEFWGYGGTPNVYQQYSALELRKMLDGIGLKCCGMHIDLKALSKENFQRTLENSQTLGNEYLNVAAAKEKMESESGVTELAETLNQAAAQCRAHKTTVGYHAHPFDFVKINGRYAWELLFSRTKPEVNMQMDVGNCLAGKGDPIAMLKEFPGRTRSIHIKEHEDKTFNSDFIKRYFGCAKPVPEPNGTSSKWVALKGTVLRSRNKRSRSCTVWANNAPRGSSTRFSSSSVTVGIGGGARTFLSAAMFCARNWQQIRAVLAFGSCCGQECQTGMSALRPPSLTDDSI